MAEDKKISQLVERLQAEFQGIWMLVIADTANATNYKIKLAEIKKYILGVVGGEVRSIGLNETGSMVTTHDPQDITNKNLSSVKINNVLVDSEVTGAQLNLLKGLDVNVKTVIDGLNGRVGSLEADTSSQDRILLTRYCYDDSFATDQLSTEKSYAIANILEKCGLNGYSVPVGKCQVQLQKRSISNSREFSPVSSGTEKIIVIADDNNNVATIKLEGLSSQVTYNISISFNVIR